MPRHQNLLYMGLTALTVVGGYFFLRYAYHIADSFPFSQEIILIVLGTVATILITAMLLNKQTEVELKKEQRVLFLELKSKIYLDILAHIEQIATSREASREDAVRLQFLGHRLTLVASPAILAEFENLLNAYNRATADNVISPADSEDLCRAMAELTIAIREDLIGEQDRQRGIPILNISAQIRENTEAAIRGASNE